MLLLGLQRISRLVTASQLPWRAIHVAGTNGKGSVCAYASSMLRAAGMSVGRFTSPHFLDRWDCIAINDKTIGEGIFRSIENEIKQKDRRLGIGATEFELLTATAFEAFAREKIDIGVVEVGLGGRLDATNILQNPLATIITRIGMDHESLLGDTLEKIAGEKAGIMKPTVPCFVDRINEPVLGNTLNRYSAALNAGPLRYVDSDVGPRNLLWHVLPRYQFAPHQQTSIALAHEAVKSALTQTGVSFKSDDILPAVLSTYWPGRLQKVDVSTIATRKTDLLLDGAHNPQAAKALRQYVDTALRSNDGGRGSSVTWVLGMSEGKSVSGILNELIRDFDQVVTTQFGAVDGMPWVRALEAETLSQEVVELAHRHQLKDVGVRSCPDPKSALQAASMISREGPLVIAGSLYLAADVIRLLRV
jgi:dihydrofolate synthase